MSLLVVSSRDESAAEAPAVTGVLRLRRSSPSGDLRFRVLLSEQVRSCRFDDKYRF
jgi:hypothetical protein